MLASNTVVSLLAELGSGSTSGARRQEAQAQLLAERNRADAWRSYRPALATASDEYVFWFALSTYECALALRWPLPAAERAEMRVDLQTLVMRGSHPPTHPPTHPPRPPPSALRKGEQLLARLGRLEFPRDDPGFLTRVVDMLATRGPSRLLGARLLTAAAAELDPTSPCSLSVNKRGAAVALVPLWPSVWVALEGAMRDEDAAELGAGVLHPPDQCLHSLLLAAARSLIRWAPFADRAAAASCAQLLTAVCERICPPMGPLHGAAFSSALARSHAALECVTELIARKDAGGVLSMCFSQHVLPAIGGALRWRGSAHVASGASSGGGAVAASAPCALTATTAGSGAAGAGGGSTAAELSNFEELLLHCVSELATGWLLRLAPAAAPQLLVAMRAEGDASAAAAPPPHQAARLTERFWSTVEVCDALLDAALAHARTREGAEGGGGSSDRDGASVLPSEAIIEGALSLLPQAISQLQQLAVGAGAAAACGGAWAAASARAALGVGGVAELLVPNEEEELEEEVEALRDAGRLACDVIGRLAEARPGMLLDGLTQMLTQMLEQASEQGSESSVWSDAEASRLGVLASLLEALLPSTHQCPEQLVSLLRMLLRLLPGAPPPHALPLPRAHACIRLALLRTLLGSCEAIAPSIGDATADPAPVALVADATAVAQLLSDAFSMFVSQSLQLLRAAASEEVASAVATQMLRAASRRWPLPVHSGAAMLHLRSSELVNEVAALPWLSARPPLLAAAASAMLLPPSGARVEQLRVGETPSTEPALVELVRSLGAALEAAAAAAGATSAAAAGGASAAAPAAIESAVMPSRCLRMLLVAVSPQERKIKSALAQPLLPYLESLLRLIEASAHARPLPLAPLSALLALLLGTAESLGGLLGSAFLPHALNTTLRTVGAVLAALGQRGVGAGAAGGVAAADGVDPEAVESFLHAALCVLDIASDPPIHKGAERAALLDQVLSAISPASLGQLLLPSHEHSLSPPRRAQLFAVVGRVLHAHAKPLRARADAAAALFALLRHGLAAPEDAQGFRACIRTVRSVLERLATSAPPPWVVHVCVELAPQLLLLRMEPSSAAVHGEEDGATAGLHAVCSAAAASAQPPESVVGFATRLIRGYLESSHVPVQAHEQLCADFGARDPSDLPSFSLSLEQLANDAACLLATVRFASALG